MLFRHINGESKERQRSSVRDTMAFNNSLGASWTVQGHGEDPALVLFV
jgi:hypothetical protein